MASLHKLLSEDGFQGRKPDRKVKFKQEDSIALPIYICHDRRSFDSSRRSRKGGSGSERSTTSRRGEPAMDDVAIKAMIAILSGYVGQYLRDESFRISMRDKCCGCFERRKKKNPSDSEIFSHMEMGIQSIEKLVESTDMKREMDLESLQKSIKIINILASLDSSNSHLSACANLYLSIIYKIARNDKISARHLLQVFNEDPHLARKHLLPELWEHFFLPHLLHLKIWYSKELDFFVNSGFADKEKRIKSLKRQYDEQMDVGTAQFADYYKEWLRTGAQAPSVPTVPLPSRSRRKSSESSASHQSTSSKSLYQEVFGPTIRVTTMDLDNGNGSSRNVWDLDIEQKAYSAEEDFNDWNYVEKKTVVHRRSSRSSETQSHSQKPDYFRFFGCRSEPTQYQTHGINMSKNAIIIKNEENMHLSRAIATICSSGSLADCETAIRAVSEAWLNSQGDRKFQGSISRALVVQGILEILYVSNDDEVLELAISILAEVAAKSEFVRQCMLSSDPNLNVSIRIMRNGSLFLKAAALLYVVKPRAKQMGSTEWVPLVLRVLEFGDQVQTLLSVKCSPHEAAYYFLNELLTGFEEDRNSENARQLVSLGGLGLLVRRMEAGDASEKSRAASVLCFCIRADGSCRHFLGKNLKKDAILSLLVMEKHTSSRHGNALELLTELLCLSRRKQRIEYLTGLTKGWEGINVLQILMLRLQRARPEERLVIAVIMLQMDVIMGDHSECSVYREEAIDAIVRALECWVINETIQEQSARALLILGGRFSYTGEPEIERWLLRKARFQENAQHPFYGHSNLVKEEDETGENWERKTAMALLSSGNTRLLSALSDLITNSIPCLACASLVTVCWMSSYFHSLEDRDLQLSACSILVPRLTEFLNDSANNLDDKILASLSLHGLTKGTDYFRRLSQLEKEALSCLENLSMATWTAKELISQMTSNSSGHLFL